MDQLKARDVGLGVTELVGVGHWDCSPQTRGRASSPRPVVRVWGQLSYCSVQRGAGSAILRPVRARDQLSAAFRFEHAWLLWCPVLVIVWSWTSSQTPATAGIWVQTCPQQQTGPDYHHSLSSSLGHPDQYDLGGNKALEHQHCLWWLSRPRASTQLSRTSLCKNTSYQGKHEEM